MQRQSNTNDGSLAPAQDASGEQSTSNNDGNGGGSTANTEGLSQGALDLLKKLENHGTYDPSTETGNQGGGYGFGELNQ